jgi:hypothetical protein
MNSSTNNLPESNQVEELKLTPSIMSSIFTPTVIENQIDSKPAIVVRISDGVNNGRKIIFLNKNFNEINSFSNNFQYLSLSVNDCALYALDNLNDFLEINKINYQGKIIDHWKINIDRDEEINTYSYLISPNTEWITYIEVSGEWGMSYETAEVQNLYLLKNDDSQKQIPTRLSNNGGATPESTSWSPDGKYLAFTDLDNNGIRQIFIFDLIGNKKIQISSFTENLTIYQIHWSPDSSWLVFSQSINVDDLKKENEIWLYSILNNNFNKIPIDDSKTGEFSLWWGKNNQILLIFEDISGEFEQLWLYDINQEMILKIIDNKNLIKNTGVNYIYSAFPITEDLYNLAIFGDPIIYNIQNDSIEIITPKIISDVFSSKYEVVQNSTGSNFPYICDK